MAATQEVGWDGAEAAITDVVQTVIMEEAELVRHGAQAQPDWSREVQIVALEAAHAIVVEAATLEHSGAEAEPEVATEAALVEQHLETPAEAKVTAEGAQVEQNLGATSEAEVALVTEQHLETTWRH